jgi:hypothetical protein
MSTIEVIKYTWILQPGLVNTALTNCCDRKCTRRLACGFAVAKLYRNPVTAYTTTEQSIRVFL